MNQGNSTFRKSLPHIVCMFIVVVAGFLTSLPMATSNTTFLYHEDDAHHFNRTVEMAKRKSLDPAYFNKPSLHFYLRMPAVYLAVLLSRATDSPISLSDIRTRDPYGLAGFSFTPSHPSVVLAVRLVTLSLNAALACIAYLILVTLFQAPILIGFAGALITLASPELFTNSYIIGVDTLMGLLTIATVWYTLKISSRWKTKGVIISGILAGLSCASKYNAAPILAVPALYWWMRSRSFKGALLIAASTFTGFFLGAPYSFISYSEFIRGISYEAWHYGIEGHAEHTTARGLPHLMKITKWLLLDGIGPAGVIFALFGITEIVKRDKKEALLFLAYPVSFILLMSLQKVFFPRNMLSVVAFFSIAATLGVWKSRDYIKRILTSLGISTKKNARIYVVQFLLLATIATPLTIRSHAYRTDALFVEDSRLKVENWIVHSRPLSRDVAVDGKLLLPIKLFSIPGVDAFNSERYSIIDLIQQGYEYFIVPTSASNLDPLRTDIVSSFPGSAEPWRIPKDPAISILHAKPKAHLEIAVPPRLEFKHQDGGTVSVCATNPDEPYCWLTTITSELSFIDAPSDHAYLEVMSPWVNQKITIRSVDGTTVSSVKLRTPGNWEVLPLPLTQDKATTVFQVILSQVHSPESQGLSSDSRRLGVAVRPVPKPVFEK